MKWHPTSILRCKRLDHNYLVGSSRDKAHLEENEPIGEEICNIESLYEKLVSLEVITPKGNTMASSSKKLETEEDQGKKGEEDKGIGKNGWSKSWKKEARNMGHVAHEANMSHKRSEIGKLSHRHLNFQWVEEAGLNMPPLIPENAVLEL